MRSSLFKKHGKSPDTGRYAHNIDLKQWDRRFFRRRPTIPECSLIEDWREYDTSGDLLAIFLRDFGSQSPSWVTEIVKEYCRGSHAFQAGGRAVQARARVCDTEIPSGRRRTHGDWLTAEGMRLVLQEDVGPSLPSHSELRANLQSVRVLKRGPGQTCG